MANHFSKYSNYPKNKSMDEDVIPYVDAAIEIID